MYIALYDATEQPKRIHVEHLFPYVCSNKIKPFDGGSQACVLSCYGSCFREVPFGHSNIIFFSISYVIYTSHGGTLRGLQAEMNLSWVSVRR